MLLISSTYPIDPARQHRGHAGRYPWRIDEIHGVTTEELAEVLDGLQGETHGGWTSSLSPEIRQQLSSLILVGSGVAVTRDITCVINQSYICVENVRDVLDIVGVH